MTRTNNDQVHVSLNGGNAVQELEPLTAFHPNKFIRNIDVGNPGEDVHPHAHWMSSDGSMMVTPNEDSMDSTLYSFPNKKIETRTVTGHTPIATTIMPDSSKYYVGNFLDSTMSVLRITGAPNNPKAHLHKTINLMGDYNPLTGTHTTPWGILPIQTPVSPDGRFMVTANILSETLTIIDTTTDTVVASLPCDAGCHGVQWGAKDGGGYYAYISNQHSNRMIVVDPQNGHDAFIAGSVLLSTLNQSSDFKTDVTGLTAKSDGMGGQGVLPVPVVYNGWVQNLPPFWEHQLTHRQRNPIGEDERGSH
jgi:hypothetical protein